MRLTSKDKIKELTTLQNNNVLMTENELKKLKLGQLEDIEDELGIDLTILFKALKNGCYVKEKNKIRFISPNCLVFDDEYLYEIKYCKGYTKLKENIYPFYFKDYGKTWALTKEELL